MKTITCKVKRNNTDKASSATKFDIDFRIKSNQVDNIFFIFITTGKDFQSGYAPLLIFCGRHLLWAQLRKLSELALQISHLWQRGVVPAEQWRYRKYRVPGLDMEIPSTLKHRFSVDI